MTQMLKAQGKPLETIEAAELGVLPALQLLQGERARAPGGAGRCSAILPPSALCHQLTGFTDSSVEQPASSPARAGTVTGKHQP